ncbi:MAG TPA: nuclear transport factor 2 family protein [Dehalococcoidia bacterium]|nr:nuclear transport factor 2 family protein [Dehalococcoidia bacterium]
MSEADNIRAVMTIYEAFGRGDIPTILDQLSDDIDWWFFGPPEIPWGGRHQGKEAVLGLFGAVGANVDVESFGPEDEPIATGDSVVVAGFERVKVRRTGKSWETHWLHNFSFRDSKIYRIREYYDTAAIVEAFR